MRTSTRVELGLYDVTARTDSTPSSADAQSWADVTADLRRDRIPALPKYGTLEDHQFLMDGSFELFPERPQGQFWGLWSRQQSGPDGRFAWPPVLDIRFAKPHSSAGLTFHFYAPTDDWASEMKIEWLDGGGNLLESAHFYPDRVNFYCEKKVGSYQRMRITFLATNHPGRYLKMTSLDYGAAMTFAGEDVIQAKVLEEVDSLSNEITINTLDLTLYSREAQFSLLNPDGVSDMLQDKQRFTVWEDVQADKRSPDVVSHNMGTFYLTDWKNKSDTVSTFSAVDAVGLLDGDPFDGGIYDTTADALAAQILTGYEYTLDPTLARERVRGYIPAGTRRTALQQLAFALGAVVDCSRSAQIKIYPPPERPSSLIGCNRKFANGSVSMRPLITGVSVTAHQYRLQTATEELYKTELPTGTHKVTFRSPVKVGQVSGAALLESGNTFAVLRVDTPGEVTITGQTYEDACTVLHKLAADLPPNAQPNELQVQEATLVSPDRADAVAQRLLATYANRIEQTFRMCAGSEMLADMLLVESTQGSMVRGQLLRMEFDLTGGFLADVRVVGRCTDKPAALYCGETYAGGGELL